MAKVLVVDDDDIFAQAAVQELTAAGHDVSHVADGAKGLATLQQGGVDLVLLDLVIPSENGVDVAKDVLAARAAGRSWATDLKVLVLTAMPVKINVEGADKVLLKPVPIDVLPVEVNKLL